MNEEIQPPQPAYVPPPSAPVAAPPDVSSDIASTLAYFTFIPAIFFLLVAPYKKNPLVRFHSFQSIDLFAAALVLQIAIYLVRLILGFIPLMSLLLFALHVVVFLTLVVCWLRCVYKASKGLPIKLPFIGDFAEKQARGL